MKGPGQLRRFEIRRLWVCPICRREEFTGGDLVALVCRCLARANPPAETQMRLSEPRRRRVAPTPVVEPVAPPETRPEAPPAPAVVVVVPQTPDIASPPSPIVEENAPGPQA